MVVVYLKGVQTMHLSQSRFKREQEVLYFLC